MTEAASKTETWRHLKNAFSNWGSIAVSAVCSFLLSPFIVHGIGNDAYGAWALIGSFIGYLGLLDLGIRSAVNRYVANYASASRHTELGILVSTALTFSIAAGTIAIVAGGAFALWGLPRIDMPSELLGSARLAVLLASSSIAVSLIAGAYQAVVVGMQRFSILNAVSVISTLSRVAAVVIGLKLGGGIVTLAMIQLVLSVAVGIAVFKISRHVYPNLRIRLVTWRSAEARTLVSYGVLSWVLQITSMFVHYADPLVIAAMLPLAQITFFAIAASLIDHARQLVSAISHLVAPHASALEGEGRGADVGEAALKGARFATLVSLPLLVTFIWRGGSFVGLWMGPEYASACGAVLVILSGARWCSASFQVMSNALMGLGRHGGLVPLTVSEAIANLVLSVWLAGHFGIVGIAMGTLIPRVVLTVGFGPWYMRRIVGLPISRYLYQSILRPSLAIIPFAVVTIWIEQSWRAEGLVVFFAQVACALPFAAVGAWVVSLDPSERELAKQALHRLGERFPSSGA